MTQLKSSETGLLSICWEQSKIVCETLLGFHHLQPLTGSRLTSITMMFIGIIIRDKRDILYVFISQSFEHVILRYEFKGLRITCKTNTETAPSEHFTL